MCIQQRVVIYYHCSETGKLEIHFIQFAFILNYAMERPGTTKAWYKQFVYTNIRDNQPHLQFVKNIPIFSSCYHVRTHIFHISDHINQERYALGTRGDDNQQVSKIYSIIRVSKHKQNRYKICGFELSVPKSKLDSSLVEYLLVACQFKLFCLC